eukprot:749335-Hanusia_phi.AAC.2
MTTERCLDVLKKPQSGRDIRLEPGLGIHDTTVRRSDPLGQIMTATEATEVSSCTRQTVASAPELMDALCHQQGSIPWNVMMSSLARPPSQQQVLPPLCLRPDALRHQTYWQAPCCPVIPPSFLLAVPPSEHSFVLSLSQTSFVGQLLLPPVITLPTHPAFVKLVCILHSTVSASCPSVRVPSRPA